jgi:hypothetical protein
LVEDLGGNRTFRQQLLLSSGVSRFHTYAPSGMASARRIKDTHIKRHSTSQYRLDSRTNHEPLFS